MNSVEEVPRNMKEFYEYITKLKAQGIEFKFESCFFYTPGLDMLTYMEKDCNFIARRIPGSNLELLCNNDENNETEKVIGVEIWNVSSVKGDFDIYPCLVHNPEMDMLVYIEQDCGFTAHQPPGSNLAILRDPTLPEKIVGIQIWNLSKIKGDPVFSKQ